MPKRYKVLISGSSGMLGIDLSKELSADYDLVGLDLSNSKKSSIKEFHTCDITDKDLVVRVIAEIHPDFVIHCAAWTDVDGCELDSKKAFLINAEGARNVALGCKSVGASMVYISTDFVFDGKKKSLYKPVDKTSPLSEYGASKLMGEEYVMNTIPENFIIRTSWLYGKNGKNFVDTIINKAKTEDVLKVVDDQIGSPTYTVDLARAIHALLDKITSVSEIDSSVYGVYHVSNSGKVSWYNYARTILKICNSKTKVVPISSEELKRPAKRPAMSVMDGARFRKFAGFNMPAWNTALKNYLLKN